MRVLVTGGTGFLGRDVISVLAAKGHEVRNFSRRAAYNPDMPSVEPFAGSVLEPDAVKEAMQGCGAVIHLAGKVSRDRKDAGELMRIHVDGTRNVMTAAVEAQGAAPGDSIESDLKLRGLEMKGMETKGLDLREMEVKALELGAFTPSNALKSQNGEQKSEPGDGTVDASTPAAGDNASGGASVGASVGAGGGRDPRIGRWAGAGAGRGSKGRQ